MMILQITTVGSNEYTKYSRLPAYNMSGLLFMIVMHKTNLQHTVKFTLTSANLQETYGIL